MFLLIPAHSLSTQARRRHTGSRGDSPEREFGARTKVSAQGAELTEAPTLLPDPESDAPLNIVALCLTRLALVLALEGSPQAEMACLEGTKWKPAARGSWKELEQKGMEGRMKDALGGSWSWDRAVGVGLVTEPQRQDWAALGHTLATFRGTNSGPFYAPWSIHCVLPC